MLLTGLLATIIAFGSALMSDALSSSRNAELCRVLAIGSLCVALATLVVVLSSPETLRVRRKSHHEALTLLVIALLVAPGVVVGLGWFLVWVAVPSVLLVPLFVGWGMSEIETPETLRHLR